MKKTELIKWLENKQTNVKNELEKKYEDAKNVLLNQKIEDSGLSETTEQIEHHLLAALKVWEKWKTDVSADDDIAISPSFYYGSFQSILNNILPSNNRSILDYFSKKEMEIQTAEMQKLHKNYSELVAGVFANYTNLIKVVKSMATAKKAAEYLISLGFDLSELEKTNKTVTALAVKIDTSYLFVDKAA